MTHEEEQLLRRYLADTGDIESEDSPEFADWYNRRRDGAEADAEYKNTLEVAHVWESRYEAGYKEGRAYTMHLVVLQAENHVAIRYRAGNAHDHINLSYEAAHDLAHALEDAVLAKRGTVHDTVGRVAEG